MSDFYVYEWLREDGTPWYVGKGCNGRAYERHPGHWAPTDHSRIRIHEMPDEATAFAYEMYLIDFWGRKDLGTGILRNRTAGGDGPQRVFSSQHLRKLREAHRNRSSEWCHNLSKGHLGNTFAVGHCVSEAVRQQIRSKMAGRKVLNRKRPPAWTAEQREAQRQRALKQWGARKATV